MVMGLALAWPAMAGLIDHSAAYRQAKADYRWLLTHPEAAKVYHNWRNLADRFRSIYTADPRGPLAPGALMWMARIHAKAWERFGRQQDFDEAVDELRRLVAHFPNSSLADDAQYMLGVLYEKAARPTQAYLEYLRVSVRYPKGDMAPRAEKALSRLERELGGKGPRRPPPRPRQGALATITALRHWSTANYTRVVISLDRPVPYTTGVAKADPKAGKPRRLYVDLRGARLGKRLKRVVPIKGGLLVRARAGQYDPQTVRVVLDIRRLGSYKVFTLADPFRVVVDCFATPIKPPSLRKRRLPRGTARQKPPPVGLAAALGLKVRRVVIDPGHGGKDPGCVWGRIKEKDLVLDIARRVAARLRKLLGCEVLLTRKRDRFIPLEERTAFANTHEADVFVSIHANASPVHSLSGVETYFLNLASDEQSMRVAARENATTRRRISDLQVILSELMLNSKINESNRLARKIHRRLIKTLRRHWRVRDLKVKQAPFYVLIGARMPAVLVEVGFITNPREYRLLRTRRYRQAIAEGIARGIVDYARSLGMVARAGRRR